MLSTKVRLVGDSLVKGKLIEYWAQWKTMRHGWHGRYCHGNRGGNIIFDSLMYKMNDI